MATLLITFVASVASLAQGSEVTLVLLQRAASLQPATATSSAATSSSPKIYVYPPEHIQMFYSCWKGTINRSDLMRGGAKHNVDYFFTKRLLSGSFPSVPAEEAELFVVPGLCSQSSFGRCGRSHTDNVRQLAEYLNSTEWFARNGGRDHFLMCDGHSAYQELTKFSSLENMILGTFENMWAQSWRGPSIGVGYTTVAAFTMCRRTAFKDWHDRKFDVHSIMGITPNKQHGRLRLLCALVQRDHDALSNATQAMDKNLMFVRLSNDYEKEEFEGRLKCRDEFVDTERFLDTSTHVGRYTFEWSDAPDGADYNHHDCDGFDSMAFSKVALSFKGDTPTTDRFIDAFEQETPVAVLATQLSEILERLPFRDVVPWSFLLFSISFEEWQRSPLESIGLAKMNVSKANWYNIVRTMRKYRDDVLWHTPQSRAANNLLREAIDIAKQAVQARTVANG